MSGESPINWKAVITAVLLIAGTFFFVMMAQFAMQTGQFTVTELVSLYINFVLAVLAWYASQSIVLVPASPKNLRRAVTIFKVLVAIAAATIAFVVGVKVARLI